MLGFSSLPHRWYRAWGGVESFLSSAVQMLTFFFLLIYLSCFSCLHRVSGGAPLHG